MLGAELSPEVACFEKADGTSLTPEETVTKLCDTHFPGNKPYKRTHSRTARQKTVNRNSSRAEFITTTKVKAAIKSFQPIKGCGPDDIPPIAYQNLGDSAVECLTAMFKASVLLGYIPKSWLKCRVIFIPKKGKKD